MDWKICWSAILLPLMFLCACGDRPTASGKKGRILLEVSYEEVRAAKPAKVQAVERMVAKVTQNGTVVLQRELQLEGGRWKGEIEVDAGSYEVELEAYKGGEVRWRGSSPVSVSSGKSNRAYITMSAVGGSVSPGVGESVFATTHEMVQVPAGDFIMGSNDGDSDEQPVHTVYLDAFYIDKYEVTNAQWNAYARATGAATKSEPGDHPVVYVSWYDARDYCSWAGLHLPTEAEWEKAARGGLEGKKYPWGDEKPVCQDGARNGARFDDNDRCNDIGTASVGSYGANGYGLYDMAGNVWEWVSDRYDSGYYSSSSSRNPTGPSSGSSRVLRGGSWNYTPYNLRAAARFGHVPSLACASDGFRCAQD